MNALRIVDWSGKAREVQFVGWLDERRLSAAVRDELGHKRVLDLQPPHRFEVRFLSPPLPPSPPVEIAATALRIPPCRASEVEARALHEEDSTANLTAAMTAPWELAAREVLYLTADHDRALREALKAHKTRRRAERRERQKKLEEWIKKDKPGEEEIAQRRRFLADRFTTMVVCPDGRSKLLSEFDVTLDEARQDWGGLRDAALHAAWLKEHRLTTESLEKDQRYFRRWLRRSAINEQTHTFDSFTRTREKVPTLRLFEIEWGVLEASIRWRVRCADGSLRWLDDFEERDVACVAEIEAIDRLMDAGKPAAPPAWHSEDWRVVYRRRQAGEVVAELPLVNEFRALCILLANQKSQRLPFTEIQPVLGTKTRELDESGTVADKSKSPAGERRVRDLLRTKTGKALLDWKVLEVQESGRERVLQLRPPSPAD